MTFSLTPGILWQSDDAAFTRAVFSWYDGRFRVINAGDLNELQQSSSTGPSNLITGRTDAFVDGTGLVYVADNLSSSDRKVLVFDISGVTGGSTGTISPTDTFSLGAIPEISAVRQAHTGHLYIRAGSTHGFLELATGTYTPLTFTLSSTSNLVYHGGYIYEAIFGEVRKRAVDTGQVLETITTISTPTVSSIYGNVIRSTNSDILLLRGDNLYLSRYTEERSGTSSPGVDLYTTRAVRIHRVNLNTLSVTGNADIVGIGVDVPGLSEDSLGRIYIGAAFLGRAGFSETPSSNIRVYAPNFAQITNRAEGTYILRSVDITPDDEVIASFRGWSTSTSSLLTRSELSGSTLSLTAMRVGPNNGSLDGFVYASRTSFDSEAPVVGGLPEVSLSNYEAIFAGNSLGVSGYECFAALRFNTDGTVEKLRGTNQAIATWQPEGNWGQNFSAGDSDSYWIRFVPSQGNATGLTGNGTPLNTWYQMDVGRIVRIDATTPEFPPPGFLPSTATTGTVQIATDSLGNDIIASGTYTVWAYFEDGS